MATDTTEPSTDAKNDTEVSGQMFANWVYQIPGLLLMIGGFAGIVFLTVT